jgi:hypothetical protein
VENRRIYVNRRVFKMTKYNILVPQSGAYNGIFMPGVPTDMNLLKELEARLGKTFSTIIFYSFFDDSFPEDQLRNALEGGVVPQIVWEPWLNNHEGIGLQSVLEGKYDAYIDSWIEGFKNLEEKVFLRLGHEMNGWWYPWSGAQNNKDTALYIAFYRYVADRFKSSGVTNVIWTWCILTMPNSYQWEEWNKQYNYYPGDEYVDWIGINGYNWGSEFNDPDAVVWNDFDEIFKATYEDVVARYPGYPIMIGEISCDAKNGDKAQWVSDTYKNIKENYSSIKGIVWFNVNKEKDWRVDSSEAVFEAFRNAIADKYYIGR